MRANYSVNTTPMFRVLSRGQIEDIYLAALEVLERTGTRVYNDEGLELLRGAGCRITDDNLVRIPSSLVRSCRQSAPERIAIAGRDRSKRMMLEYNKVYFGTVCQNKQKLAGTLRTISVEKESL